MDAIFHEKQEGSLCAQHCLNSLLQSEYFSAVDLAEIASELDKQELKFMYQPGSSDYEKFLQQPSSNYDDSGYFSIQVLQKALSSFNLELIPYQSQNPIALEAKRNPTTQQAYICNFKDHWYTIRKFGGVHWFNLNSVLKKPQYVSDTYLSVLLAQLMTDGYSIFIVNGALPSCQADLYLPEIPKETLMVQYPITAERGPSNRSRNQRNYAGDDDDYDADIKAAIEASLMHDEDEIRKDNSFQNAIKTSKTEFVDHEDNELELAIALSLQNEKKDVNSPGNTQQQPQQQQQQTKNDENLSVDELRRKRLEFLDKQNKTKD